LANPTTNYGWVLPTPTDLVTDLPADFDVALQGVDNTTKALNPSTTLGDIEYRSATANTNTRLPIGTTGQVLQVVSGVPAWVTAGSGAVVQVKSFTTSTSTTITSATFASTALTLSITPTSSSNKILVFGQLPSFFYQNVGTSGNYNGVGLRIVRGATNIFTSEPGEAFNYDNFDEAASGNMFIGSPVAYSYLDSPATTSATTYTLQGCVQAPSGTALFNYHNTGTITLMEVTP
jgi:hypothetical protein